jgi:hypothetical protein
MFKQRAQTTEPKLEHHKELPCTYASSPWAKAHSPWTNAAMQHGNAAKSKNCSTCPGRLDRLHRAVRPPAPDLTAWGRLDRPKRPALYQTAQKFARPNWNTFQTLQVPKTCTNFSPLLTMHESRQNAKSFNIKLLKYTKFITRGYTSPNEQVRYSTRS